MEKLIIYGNLYLLILLVVISVAFNLLADIFNNIELSAKCEVYSNITCCCALVVLFIGLIYSYILI